MFDFFWNTLETLGFLFIFAFVLGFLTYGIGKDSSSEVPKSGGSTPKISVETK